MVASPIGGQYVHNGMLTEKVKVAVKTESDWSDDVFAKGYRLMPLADVSKHIARHGHLPGVPSAKEMVKEGLDVAATDAMLLRKIEEITLHMIQLSEELIALRLQNEQLKSALTRLERKR
ncbi:MAG: hypothetical protein IPL52_05245 [Flavobacteriales bacterium]|nr:hypothetical protein [Flavobacteriales bacterium]